jgi:hypothetical protein
MTLIWPDKGGFFACIRFDPPNPRHPRPIFEDWTNLPISL